MESTARFAGHPIHPMLIPYPFAFLSSAAVFDLAGRIKRRESLWTTGAHLANAGIATALVAAVPGLVDYLFTIPWKTTAKKRATYHMFANLGGLALFALASARRDRSGRPGPDALALEVLGTALLGTGGWLGGSLVYHDRVGIAGREAPVGLEGQEQPQLTSGAH